MPEHEELRRGVHEAFGGELPGPGFTGRDVLAGGRRRRRERRAAWGAAAAAGLAGVMALTLLPGERPTQEEPAASSPTAGGEVVMTGTIFDEPGETQEGRTEDDDALPYLCLDGGGELTSRRPCRDRVTLVGWRRPPGVEPWSSRIVVGRIDGDRLTVTDSSEPRESEPDEPSFPLLCDEPPGGWVKKLPWEGYYRVDGYSHFWLSYPPDAAPSSDGSEPDWENLVEIPSIAVTGDVERARAEAEEIAGGPVCVVHTERPMRTARWIASTIKRSGEPGTQVRTVPARPQDAMVEVTVRYDDGTLQRRYDERFGAGWVYVQPRIHPVDYAPPTPG